MHQNHGSKYPKTEIGTGDLQLSDWIENRDERAVITEMCMNCFGDIDTDIEREREPQKTNTVF